MEFVCVCHNFYSYNEYLYGKAQTFMFPGFCYIEILLSLFKNKFQDHEAF